MISGPLPSTEVKPKGPWWDSLFAEQEPGEVDNSWAPPREIAKSIAGWVISIAAFVIAAGVALVVRYLVTGSIT